MKFLRLVTTAAVLLLAGSQAGAELANAIRSVVDDGVITDDEVKISAQRQAGILYRRYASDTATLERQLNEVVYPQVLQTLVERQLILHEFKTGGYSLPESVVDELVDDEIKAHYQNSRALLDKSLEKEGMTREQFRKQIREQFIVAQMRLKNVSTDKIFISPHKVEAYYQDHKDDYKVEEEVKLGVIVLKATDDTNAPPPARLAQDILMQLNQGASFEQMATLYSQGSQRAQGGEWGWHPRDELTKGLSDIAFSLPVGKCSSVCGLSRGDDCWVYEFDKGERSVGRHYAVDSKSGKQVLLEERKCLDHSCFTNLPPAEEFYLLKVEDKHPAHYKALSDVRDEIEKTLFAAESTRLQKEWMDRLTKKTFVKYF